jgi:lysophospholipase L1-like esterase
MMRRAAIVIATALAVDCGSRRAATPVAPAPPPVPNPPAISCPADLSAEARVAGLPPVNFDIPLAEQGQPPVIVSCDPAPGALFSVGKTTVTCDATDALARKASCTFTVNVADIPRIQKTRFMAFGDSLTEGKLALQFTSPVQPDNYEAKLRAELQARYELQSIVMVSEPESGEPTGEGKSRFQGAFLQAAPEVVLLLEGTNDLLGAQDKATIDSAVEALANMVQYAKAHGARVFIATLPPMNGALFNLRNAAPAVPVLNARIRTMAANEGINLVDLEPVIPLSLIGPDGKHPTAQGYQKIADTFYDAIKAVLEVKPPTPQ